MDLNDLQMLMREFPEGDWFARAARLPRAVDIICQAPGGEVVVARDIEPKAASFLIHAKTWLLTLAQGLDEERAYSAQLAQQNQRLALAHQELSESLAEIQEEIFNESRQAVAVAVAAPLPVMLPAKPLVVPAFLAPAAPQKYLM